MMRLWHMIAPARVKLVDDTKDVQRVQVSQGNTGSDTGESITDNVPVVGLFGHASVPPVESEVVLVRIGGDRGQSMAVASNHRPSRPKNLQPGDSGIYDIRGAQVMLTANGLMIDCAGLPAVIQNTKSLTVTTTDAIVLDAPSVELKHDLKVDGAIHATGQISTDADVSVAGNLFTTLRNAYNIHFHYGVMRGSAHTDPTIQLV